MPVTFEHQGFAGTPAHTFISGCLEAAGAVTRADVA